MSQHKAVIKGLFCKNARDLLERKYETRFSSMAQKVSNYSSRTKVIIPNADVKTLLFAVLSEKSKRK